MLERRQGLKVKLKGESSLAQFHVPGPFPGPTTPHNYVLLVPSNTSTIFLVLELVEELGTSDSGASIAGNPNQNLLSSSRCGYPDIWIL